MWVLGAYKFWLPQTLPTNSLLLARSLTDNLNSQLTYILPMYYILYSYDKLGKETVKKSIRKRKYIYTTVL